VRQSTEHPVEHFGHGRGPFYKSSDEGSWVVSMRNALVFERDLGTLWLLAAAPRRWFAPGEVISARAMASWFGPCGVLVEGGADSIRARVTLPSRNPPPKCVLFLRHWEGKPLRSAFLLDEGGARGKALPLSDAAEGGVDLSGLSREIQFSGLSGEIQLEGQF